MAHKEDRDRKRKDADRSKFDEMRKEDRRYDDQDGMRFDRRQQYR